MSENPALHDIQSYLESFNKEISDAAGPGAFEFNVADPMYGGTVPTPVAIQVSPMAEGQSYSLTALENSSGIQGIVTDSVPATPQTVKRKRGRPPKNPKPVSTPAANYQTVTIVPSEVSQTGEVSYVLIVSQPETDKDGNVAEIPGAGDMSVYDFKEERSTLAADGDDDGTRTEGGEGRETVATSSEGRPRRTGRVPSRRLALVDDEEEEEEVPEAANDDEDEDGDSAREMITCDYCSYTTNKMHLLERHIKSHSTDRPHVCQICNRHFKTQVALHNHVNTHTGTKPHRCKECRASFTTSGELIRHVRYRHTFEKPHKCIECEYASVERSKLKRHMRSHTGERPYQCPHCTYASPDTYKLKRHLRIHTGERPYQCPYCHARFTQSNSCKAHMLIHTGQKPVFQCELCPTTCGRKIDLKNHVLKLHTSDKPIQCKKCGKSFPDRYTYKVHLKMHEGEKCFRCELCSYSALTQRHLEAHILTHTGEKPFRCELCDLSFRQKQLLKRHVNLYHNPDYSQEELAQRQKVYHCTECGRSFAHNANLMRHMLIHDPDNPIYQQYVQQGDGSDNENGEEEGEEEEEGEGDGEDGEMQNTHDDGLEGFVADGELDESSASLLDGPVHLQVVGADGKATTLILQSVGNQLQASQLPLHSSLKSAGSTGKKRRAAAMAAVARLVDDDGDDNGVAVEDEDYEPAVVRSSSGRGRKRKSTGEAANKSARRDSGKIGNKKANAAAVRKDLETCFGFDGD